MNLHYLLSEYVAAAIIDSVDNRPLTADRYERLKHAYGLQIDARAVHGRVLVSKLGSPVSAPPAGWRWPECPIIWRRLRAAYYGSFRN